MADAGVVEFDDDDAGLVAGVRAGRLGGRVDFDESVPAAVSWLSLTSATESVVSAAVSSTASVVSAADDGSALVASDVPAAAVDADDADDESGAPDEGGVAGACAVAAGRRSEVRTSAMSKCSRPIDEPGLRSARPSRRTFVAPAALATSTTNDTAPSGTSNRLTFITRNDTARLRRAAAAIGKDWANP